MDQVEGRCETRYGQQKDGGQPPASTDGPLMPPSEALGVYPQVTSNRYVIISNHAWNADLGKKMKFRAQIKPELLIQC
jgi:hypothetical protein